MPTISGRVVRAIRVSCDSEDFKLERYYDSSEKMQQVLLCIRSLGPMFLPDRDPDGQAGPTIAITLTCADGSCKTYLQKGRDYFRSGKEPWRQLKPEKGERLLDLLAKTPSDPPPEVPYK